MVHCPLSETVRNRGTGYSFTRPDVLAAFRTQPWRASPGRRQSCPSFAYAARRRTLRRSERKARRSYFPETRCSRSRWHQHQRTEAYKSTHEKVIADDAVVVLTLYGLE
jgi:hypothetical protein